MPLIKYGKPNLDIIEIKQSFISQNADLKKDQMRVNRAYMDQPRRSSCKNCEHSLGDPSFVKEAIEYFACPQCGHLNGAYEETEAFCAAAYTDDFEEQYAGKYRSEDEQAFRKRTETIYVPKAEFLAASLKEAGEDPQSLSYGDLGAGSGYMVSALRSLGLNNSIGYEVSHSQVQFGNAMIGDEALLTHGIDATAKVAGSMNRSVATMIGTLEHFLDPRGVLAALTKNPTIEYVFFSVPLFSATVFFDLMFPQAQQAQLGGRHTHLYTEQSIDWFCKEFGFKRIGEWWFGSDFIHLLRHMAVRIGQENQPAATASFLEKTLTPSLDDLQRSLDQKKLSSEVHMLLKKCSN